MSARQVSEPGQQTAAAVPSADRVATQVERMRNRRKPIYSKILELDARENLWDSSYIPRGPTTVPALAAALIMRTS